MRDGRLGRGSRVSRLALHEAVHHAPLSLHRGTRVLRARDRRTRRSSVPRRASDPPRAEDARQSGRCVLLAAAAAVLLCPLPDRRLARQALVALLTLDRARDDVVERRAGTSATRGRLEFKGSLEAVRGGRRARERLLPGKGNGLGGGSGEAGGCRGENGAHGGLGVHIDDVVRAWVVRERRERDGCRCRGAGRVGAEEAHDLLLGLLELVRRDAMSLCESKRVDAVERGRGGRGVRGARRSVRT